MTPTTSLSSYGATCSPSVEVCQELSLADRNVRAVEATSQLCSQFNQGDLSIWDNDSLPFFVSGWGNTEKTRPFLDLIHQTLNISLLPKGAISIIESYVISHRVSISEFPLLNQQLRNSDIQLNTLEAKKAMVVKGTSWPTIRLLAQGPLWIMSQRISEVSSNICSRDFRNESGRICVIEDVICRHPTERSVYYNLVVIPATNKDLDLSKAELIRLVGLIHQDLKPASVPVSSCSTKHTGKRKRPSTPESASDLYENVLNMKDKYVGEMDARLSESTDQEATSGLQAAASCEASAKNN